MTSRLVHCKKSPHGVYIGRPGKWGNPYSHDPKAHYDFLVGSRDEAILRFTEYILRRPDLLRDLRELRGKVLGCWCTPKACHGEVLLYLQERYYPDVAPPPYVSDRITVAVDPGLHACGVAIFRGTTLIDAFLVSSEIPQGLRDQLAWDQMEGAIRKAVLPLGHRIEMLVLEDPQNYGARSFIAQVDKDDIDQLRGINRSVLRALRPTAYVKYHPHQWKGSVEKRAMLRRIREWLRPEELAVIRPVPKNLGHGKGIDDILDAIGIGLHHLGRRLI